MTNVLDMFSLQGKTALLTGGAGLYGRQITAALCEAGARTWIASRNLDALQETADRYGAKALQLNLESEESIDHVVSQIVAESGTIDVLVNNAVTRVACARWDQPMSVFDQSLHVNASALFHLTRRTADVMKEHKCGSIINIGSYMGLLGGNPSNYEGTNMGTLSPIYFYEKGGMTNFTRWAASELGPFGIRVNCICPGGLENDQPEMFLKNYAKNTMLGRLAGQDDLKGIIVFLASNASAYLTGTNIPVDGGYSAK
ncbi:MAG: SDR family oxidoreductase [Thermoguttaceae bacterium]|nr:SDR family oxidoreductase [Thermoguttaceae bacterium]